MSACVAAETVHCHMPLHAAAYWSASFARSSRMNVHAWLMVQRPLPPPPRAGRPRATGARVRAGGEAPASAVQRMQYSECSTASAVHRVQYSECSTASAVQRAQYIECNTARVRYSECSTANAVQQLRHRLAPCFLAGRAGQERRTFVQPSYD
jgi:hypothetical protein